jgi:hypothetical protein
MRKYPPSQDEVLGAFIKALDEERTEAARMTVMTDARKDSMDRIQRDFIRDCEHDPRQFKLYGVFVEVSG